MTTLKEVLEEWTDFDTAAWKLALCLGMMREDELPKSVFWTSNPTGDALYRMLLELVALEVLESREDATQFRWNRSFRGDWEGHNDRNNPR